MVVRSTTTLNLIAGGIDACELRQQRANPVDGVDHVRPRLPEHNDQYSGFSVGKTRIAAVLHRIVHVRRCLPSRTPAPFV